MSGERLDWVDVAKGLSIILVVMMHSAFGVGEETGSAGVLHTVIAWATPFRMPEFFLISGLFLAHVLDRDWRLFGDRRVIHYVYFYVLWAALQIAFKVALGVGDPFEAARQFALAAVEPYGVLWFIYLLALFNVAVKLLHTANVPHWVALAAGAALQIAPVATGLYALDQFAEYFVYYYAGYALAAPVFRAVAAAQRHAFVALGALVAYGIVNGLLVFNGGFAMHPGGAEIGYAGLPGVRLVLALTGSLALCVLAGLLARLPLTGWLRWLGEHSIVVYLSFSIPMAASRVLLLKLGVEDTSLVSTAVMLVALTAPLVLYWLIQRTSVGRFLFERPAWAHLPGTPGSRGTVARAVPAE